MASPGFMFVTAAGATIRGESSVTSDGRENSIQVVELNHEVDTPVDASSGSASGQRHHHVLRVKARVDSAVPEMYKAWSNNELCEVQIRFWRADPMGTGAETEFFKISLEGAVVAAINMHWPNSLASQTASVTEQVEYAFTYQKITWDFLPGGRVHEDEWYRRRS